MFAQVFQQNSAFESCEKYITTTHLPRTGVECQEGHGGGQTGGGFLLLQTIRVVILGGDVNLA